MKRILSLIFSICLIFSLLIFSGCQNKNGSDSAWIIDEQIAGDVKLENYAVFKLTMPEHNHTTGHSHAIKGIWFNADSKSNDIKIKFAFSSVASMSAKKSQEVETSFSSKVGNGGEWKDALALFSDASTANYSYAYVEIAIVDSVRINEVAFVNNDGTLFIPELVRMGERPEGSNQSKNELTASEISASNSNNKLTNTPLNIIDDQSSFNLALIENESSDSSNNSAPKS